MLGNVATATFMKTRTAIADKDAVNRDTGIFVENTQVAMVAKACKFASRNSSPAHKGQNTKQADDNIGLLRLRPSNGLVG
jgi:hypothetical protein